MELALVSFDQTEVVPAAIEGASAIGSNSKVAIVRAVFIPDRSSPAEEVGGVLKRKNCHVPQEMTTIALEMAGNKRRLVKESELVSSQKKTSSSSLPQKPSSDRAGKGKRSVSKGQ